jgi:hypothetical protein
MFGSKSSEQGEEREEGAELQISAGRAWQEIPTSRTRFETSKEEQAGRKLENKQTARRKREQMEKKKKQKERRKTI